MLFLSSQDILSKKVNMFNKELKLRIISSVVILISIIFTICMGGLWFNSLIIIVALLANSEIHVIGHNKPDANMKNFIINCFCIILIIDTICLLYLNLYYKNILFWILLNIIATDTGAYFIGKNFGIKKICTNVSPNKTFLGCFGGLFFALFCGIIFNIVFYKATFWPFLKYSLAISIIAQAGDFFESMFKRHFNVKDSGNIIPGHGGVLDRIDGLTLVLPFVVLLILINKIPI